MAKTTRGIRIALSRKSWELVCEALQFMSGATYDYPKEKIETVNMLLYRIRVKLDGPDAKQ